MYETEAEIAELDQLLGSSLDGASDHLRLIMTEDERTLDAAETCRVLTGMKTLALATVTKADEPRISGVDGALPACAMGLYHRRERGQGAAPARPPASIRRPHRG